MSNTETFFGQFGTNSGYVEDLYRLYCADPGLVSEDWKRYFQSLCSPAEVVSQHQMTANYSNGKHAATAPQASASVLLKAADLVAAFRAYGHLRASFNPLGKGYRNPVLSADILEQVEAAITPQEWNQSVPSFGFASADLTLTQLHQRLKESYCGSIGIETAHLINPIERKWIQERIEAARPQFSSEQRRQFLQELIKAEGLENELHRTFVGAKRFSLQGGETLMPLLLAALERGSSLGVTEAIVGMAHRGRLNVLTHLAGKPYEMLCAEFEDQTLGTLCGAGDVKYHLGFKNKKQLASGRSVEVQLVPNPSHLEFVNPVVEGVARSLQDSAYARERKQVLPVLIHGDAAFIGQGIVWETLNFAAVDGYRTGGSFHVIINNQVGFTTYPEESRGSLYSSDIAKGIYAPIFHVNAEDVDTCCWVAELALEYRQTFGRDVVIDLICYRKYGHNEGDDPSFTQPVLYSEINAKESIANLYGKALVAAGAIADEDVKQIWENFSARFKAARAAAKPLAFEAASPVHGKLWDKTSIPQVQAEELERIAQSLTQYPEGFAPHPKLHKILEKRIESLKGGKTIDWGFAEALAFGSLVSQGRRIRLSGQDSGRGTFSQRHLMLRDHQSQEFYLPLNRLSPNGQALFEVYNSTLSEASVMAFEFGYAHADQDTLVLWEGQFGDFANGAQVIIDQFLASSESKWGQRSGLVLLLPHGFEGQGPEHSSARLERYLQLCAEGNWTVAHPSSADQYFHLLRRHALNGIKRPLVVMTPKSLLRSASASCSLEALTAGEFNEVLSQDCGAAKPKQAVLCSGKVYYDLLPVCEKAEQATKVIRLEQLYPFPEKRLAELLKGMNSVLWVQEEPLNSGAWTFVEPRLRALGTQPRYIGRPASSSPATGSAKHSAAELQQFLTELKAALG